MTLRSLIYQAVRAFHDYTDDVCLAIRRMEVDNDKIVAVVESGNRCIGGMSFMALETLVFHRNGEIQTNSRYFIRRPDAARPAVLAMWEGRE